MDEQISLNSFMVSEMISFTGFMLLINPTDWPESAGAAFMLPPKYKS